MATAPSLRCAMLMLPALCRRYVAAFLPRAVYTSGKSSSAAGLTATVVKVGVLLGGGVGRVKVENLRVPAGPGRDTLAVRQHTKYSTPAQAQTLVFLVCAVPSRLLP